MTSGGGFSFTVDWLLDWFELSFGAWRELDTFDLEDWPLLESTDNCFDILFDRFESCPTVGDDSDLRTRLGEGITAGTTGTVEGGSFAWATEFWILLMDDLIKSLFKNSTAARKVTRVNLYSF